MKRVVYNIIAIAALLLASCEDNESMLQPNDFSDVSFICSQLTNQYSDNIIEVGSPISFMDLSQNAVTHTWTIDERCAFLYGEYDKNDTVYDEFIIPNAGTQTTDVTMFVLFQEPGTDVKVRINNSFSEEVSFVRYSDDMAWTPSYSSEYEIGSTYNTTTGLWDFEAECSFYVLDYVDAKVEVRRLSDDELLGEVAKGVVGDTTESDSWDVVNITTDDVIAISAEVYGEPGTVTWNISSSYLMSYDALASTTEVVSTNPVVTKYTRYYQPSKLSDEEGFNLGAINLVRSSSYNGDSQITQPSGYLSKQLPLRVVTTMGEGDLTATYKATDFNQITLYLSALGSTELPANVASDFTVAVSNDGASINETIAARSVAYNSSRSAVVITLESDIYLDDEITFKYNPSGVAITDTYGRELASINDSYDSNEFSFFDPVITDSDLRGFEEGGTTSWYIQHSNYWSLSSERSNGGDYSMKFNNTTAGSSTEYYTVQNNNCDDLTGDAGEYILKAWVYLESGASVDTDIRFTINNPWTLASSTTSSMTDAPTGVWTELEQKFIITSAMVGGTTTLNMTMPTSNTGTIFVDDISLERKMTRQ